jgi:hypothetical protein
MVRRSSERYTKCMFSPRRARRTRRCRQDQTRILLLLFHFWLLSSFFVPFIFGQELIQTRRRPPPKADGASISGADSVIMQS